jgi:hypothetical protein
MKTFLFLVLLIPYFAYSQAPELFSFQAIVRHPDTSLVINKQISAKISILKGGINGNVVYSETHSPTTNNIGLFSLQIGGGTVVSGDFSAIDWGSDTYFLKRELDPSGGSNYVISGTSQLLSVPYALHSKTTEKINTLGFEPSFLKYIPKYETLSVGNIENFTVPKDSFFLANGALRQENTTCDFEVDGGILGTTPPKILPANKTFSISSQTGNSNGNCDIHIKYQIIPISLLKGTLITITLKADGSEKYIIPENKILYLFDLGYCLETYSPENKRINNPYRPLDNLNYRVALYPNDYIVSNCQYPNYGSDVKTIQKTTIIGLLVNL